MTSVKIESTKMEEKRGTAADEGDRKVSLPPPSSSHGTLPDDDDITYPEGGLRAWLVVFGAWSGLAASLGIYNSTGVIEAYLSRELLRDESPSTIGWIFGVYAFMTWFCGAQVGPTFDAKGPRGLLIAGSLCTLIGIFALSFATGESKPPLSVSSICLSTYLPMLCLCASCLVSGALSRAGVRMRHLISTETGLCSVIAWQDHILI